MFGICFEENELNSDDELVQMAKITIDNFSEYMQIPLDYWSIEDYKASWKKSIAEGIEKKDHAALVVSMYEPEYLNFIFTWIMYFESEKVYIQNSAIFVDEYKAFDANKINKFIQPRKIYNEDGIKISEWVTSLSNIKQFYKSL